MPPASTVTVASGSLVPDTAGVVVTVAPAAGAVIATGGGKSVTFGDAVAADLHLDAVHRYLPAAVAQPEVGAGVLQAAEVGVWSR